VVSHNGITLSVGAPAVADSTAKPDSGAVVVPGQLHVVTGTPVTRVASALHAMKASPADVAAIFESLRSVGALSAEVVIR
jgi:flagellar basal body P-ring protein FlgI